MTPSPELSVAELSRAAAASLGVPAKSLVLNRCRTGKYNATWFIRGAAESELVLSVAPPDERRLNLFYEYRMMRQEPGLHDTLRQRTGVPVPGIVVRDFSRELIERDFLVMEKMPGEPLSEATGVGRRELDRVLAEVGRALRQVHALHAGSYGYIGEHRPHEPAGSWNEAFGLIWRLLIEDIRACGGYSAGEADAMLRLLDSHLDAFDRSEPASLLHMDVWAQNILIGDSGRLVGLLDWDRALWGDVEIEFAVLDYCGISEPAFWEGYGEKRENGRAARIRRVFYLLYELQKYIFIRRVRGGDPSLADSYRSRSLQLAATIGLDH